MSLGIYNGYAFAGTWGKTIERIRLSDFTYVDQLTPSGIGGNWYKDAVVDDANGFGYFVADGWPTQVTKVNLSTFTVVSTLDMPDVAGSREGCSIEKHGNYLYVGTCDGYNNNNTNAVLRISLSDFSTVDTLTLSSGEENLGTLVADHVNGILYVGASTSPAQIVKVDLSNFTRVGVLAFNSGENGLEQGCFVDNDRGHLVCATRDMASNEKIIRINLSNFTRADSITLNEAEIVCSAYNSSTGKAFFGVNTAPAQVVKIDMATFTEEAVTAAFNSGENYTPNCILGGSYLYVGVMGSGKGVVKVAP